MNESALHENQKTGGWSLGRFALLLAALIVIAFPEPILFAKSFVFRDFGGFGYPLAVYHREAFWKGEIPLWNPYNCSGLPFLAQWNTLVLYPLSAIYLLFPPPWSVTFFCLFHLWWGGVGACLFVQRWTNSSLAGWCAGIAFTFNGLALNCLMWPNNVAALSWFPWLLFTINSASNLGGRWLVPAAAVATVQLFSGAPEIILFSWLFVFAHVLTSRDVAAKQAILRMLLVAGLAALTASAQLFPFLDLLINSQRGIRFGDSTWSMPSWGWLNLVVPLFRSYQSPAKVFFQENQDWTSSYYPGVIVMLLAVSILGRRSAWLWVLALAGLIMALGEKAYLFTAMQKSLHFLGFMRFPIKFVLLPAMAFPLMAGLAIAVSQSQIEKEKISWRKKLMLAAIFLGLTATILAVISYFRPFPFESLRNVQVQSAVSRLFLLGIALLVLRYLGRAATHEKHRIVGLVLVLLLWVDGWSHAPNQNPSVEASVMVQNLSSHQFGVLPKLGTERAFLTKPAHDNFYKMMVSDQFQNYLLYRMALMMNCNLLDGVPTLHGFYSLYLPNQQKVFEPLFYAPTNRPVEGVLSFLGVGRVGEVSDIIGWRRRTGALPLATVGQSPKFLPEAQMNQFLFSTNFHPGETVVLSDRDQDRINVRSNSLARVLNSSIGAHKMVFEVESRSDAMLVCAQTFYHPWVAEIDGKRVPIFRANLGYQAMEVPAGRHQVILIYRDRMFWAGCIASGFGLLAMLILWFSNQKDNS